MNILKHICRYFFMALLLAGCILWSIYCGNAAAQLQAQIESPAYIDLALRSTSDALALLDRKAHFETLARYGILAAIVVVLLTCVMIAIPILVKKLKNRSGKKDPAAAQPVPKPASHGQPPQGTFCPHCGKPQNGDIKFCSNCGGPLS